MTWSKQFLLWRSLNGIWKVVQQHRTRPKTIMRGMNDGKIDPELVARKKEALQKLRVEEEKAALQAERKEDWYLFWIPLFCVALIYLPEYYQRMFKNLPKEEAKELDFESMYEEPLGKKLQPYFEAAPSSLPPWMVTLATALPLRLTSRLWGWANSFELPFFMRDLVLKSYSSVFGCNLEEMEYPLECYSSLGEFFTRRLKKGARTISEADLVSPVDGRVLYFGPVEANTMEQVKGVRYSLSSFLGVGLDVPSWTVERPADYDDTEPDPTQISLRRGKSAINKDKFNKLFHIAIYLAPGDYHGLHSPTDWTINFRRHFPGHLFPVAPFATSFIQGLFSLNERVAYVGQ
eukprot:TRINITY_DN4883_c0_g1_i1.p1 TRINITY_DN4883_c0_g1~~TRINITY_DN4883_c0_g1_i1.p1  ORF type:complete len:348 (-),score=65.96 TRINITY_DN4883_c0_g1_i1:329-1372(-)